MKVGVLAVQGDFDAHRKRLEELGAEVVLVRKPEQLDEIAGLVLPGGESGAILRILGERGVEKLKQFVRGKPAFGTCAGAILLAKEITNPEQPGQGNHQPRAARPGRSGYPHPPQCLRTPDRQLNSRRTARQRSARDGFYPRAKN